MDPTSIAHRFYHWLVANNSCNIICNFGNEKWHVTVTAPFTPPRRSLSQIPSHWATSLPTRRQETRGADQIDLPANHGGGPHQRNGSHGRDKARRAGSLQEQSSDQHVAAERWTAGRQRAGKGQRAAHQRTGGQVENQTRARTSIMSCVTFCFRRDRGLEGNVASTRDVFAEWAERSTCRGGVCHLRSTRSACT